MGSLLTFGLKRLLFKMVKNLNFGQKSMYWCTMVDILDNGTHKVLFSLVYFDIGWQANIIIFTRKITKKILKLFLWCHHIGGPCIYIIWSFSGVLIGQIERAIIASVATLPADGAVLIVVKWFALLVTPRAAEIASFII